MGAVCSAERVEALGWLWSVGGGHQGPVMSNCPAKPQVVAPEAAPDLRAVRELQSEAERAKMVEQQRMEHRPTSQSFTFSKHWLITTAYVGQQMYRPYKKHNNSNSIILMFFSWQ